MQTFKNRLCRIAGGYDTIKTIIMMLVVVLVLVIIGAVQLLAPFHAFDPFGKPGTYMELTVTYIMGPFAAQTQNNRTSDEYYIAEDAEGYWYLVDLNPGTKLPVYGVDVFDADLDGLPGVRVRGTGRAVEAELVPYLIDFVGPDLTMSNYSQYFGDVYLDSTNGSLPSAKAGVWFLFAGALAVTGVLLLIYPVRRGSKMKKILNQMEQNGTLQPLYEDFSAGTPLYSESLKLAVSGRYLVDASDLENGLRVLGLADYTNAYRCNMLDGNPSSTYYLALEKQDGSRIGVGFCPRASKLVERIVPKVRLGLSQKEAAQ